MAVMMNIPPSGNGPSSYLPSNRTLVTISPVDTGIGIPPVSGIIPPEYGFSVANKYDPLLSGDQGIADVQKGIQAFNDFIGDTGLSLVPYSPMIWMGSEAISVSEMTLHFIAFSEPYKDVHLNLINLLAMGLPGGKGVTTGGAGGLGGGFEAGMLTAPPAVEIRIGSVIAWKPCFLEQVAITEFAPYTKEGYGMRGEAKFKIIRRDFVFGGDFAATAGTTNSGARPVNAPTRPVSSLPPGVQEPTPPTPPRPPSRTPSWASDPFD